jgi:hypothetical protein
LRTKCEEKPSAYIFNCYSIVQLVIEGTAIESKSEFCFCHNSGRNRCTIPGRDLSAAAIYYRGSAVTVEFIPFEEFEPFEPIFRLVDNSCFYRQFVRREKFLRPLANAQAIRIS